MNDNNLRGPLLAFVITALLAILFIWLTFHTTYTDNKSMLNEPAELPEVVMCDQPESPFIIHFTNEEYQWLCRLVSAESRGESLEGQIAVANVVMNRVASPLFPDTIMGVIFQKGQYCPVRNRSIYMEPTEQSKKAVRMALAGHKVVPDDVLYFYAPAMVSRGNWIRSREVVKQIGVHVFATQDRRR